MAASCRRRSLKHKLDEALATTSTAKTLRSAKGRGSSKNDSGISSSTSAKKKSVNSKASKPTSKGKKRSDNTVSSSDKLNPSDVTEMDISQLLALGEGGESESIAAPLPESSSESEQSDWEEVRETIKIEEPVIPKEGVNITVEAPSISFKRKKKETDLEGEIRRQLKRRQREIQELVHKVHLLCWIAHVKYVNTTLNSPPLLAQSLLLVKSKTLYPPKHADLEYLERVVAWFKKNISLMEKFEDYDCKGRLQNQLSCQLSKSIAFSRNHLVFMLVIALRSLGLQVRLITSCVTLPLKPAADKLTQLPLKKMKTELDTDVSTSKIEKKVKVNSEQSSKTSKTSTVSKKQPSTSSSPKKIDGKPPAKTSQKAPASKKAISRAAMKNNDKNVETPSKASKPSGVAKRQRRSCTKNAPVELSDSEEEFSKHFKETPVKKREMKPSSSKENTLKVKKEEANSDDDFSPVTYRAATGKKNIDRRVLSTDEEDEGEGVAETSVKQVKKVRQDYWAEVFLEAEEKWICIDIIKGKIHCISQLYSKATQPVVYVLAANNDLTLKDVTKRYVPHWHSDTRKRRVSDSWWQKTMSPYLPASSAREREEDEDIARQLQDMPLPTSISEYKSHPLYALQRHLLKFEAIYPPDAPPIGYIRKEPVYARECVVTLRSRDIWFKEARIVRPKESCYKVVKSRPKYDRMTGDWKRDLPLELFGIWQTEDYIPPNAVDGKVPRNEYGNVDLFKPCMLPGGTVHLQVPALNRVARKLGIDCAPAIVGFEFHSGGSHPVQDGFVVCEEFRYELMEAWSKDIDESAKRAEEKREKRVYGNWRRLIRGLLIRENLKIKYAFGEHSDDEASASTSNSTSVTSKKPAKKPVKRGRGNKK